MAYNQLAEQWVTDPHLSARLFSDLADETPTEEKFRISDLVGKIESIKHYAPKTQGDILRALAVRMRAPEWPGDGLERLQSGVYRWRFHDWSAA